MELELADFDLPTAIDSAVMLVRERAGRRNIALHTVMGQELGQIQADERKVRQVVLNLLSNAIKFTPEGGRIEVSATPRNGSVEVSVSDTGIGIAPEDQEKVFEEFRQVGTASKKIAGTGLGLTLCRKFVGLHGGKIWGLWGAVTCQNPGVCTTHLSLLLSNQSASLLRPLRVQLKPVTTENLVHRMRGRSGAVRRDSSASKTFHTQRSTRPGA
jgi:K+-sensing histidine kinase KdpD